MSVSAEDREKAIAVVQPGQDAVLQGTMAWASSLATTTRAVDALVAAGWGPGGVSARPTREALTAVVKDARFIATPRLEHGYAMPVPEEIALLVDALLAANHLWTEQPAPTIDLDAVGRTIYPDWDSWDDDDEQARGIRQLVRTAIELGGGMPRASAPVVDREAIAKAIHDGPNAQAQYAKAGIPAHAWESCAYQAEYRADADAVLALFGGQS